MSFWGMACYRQPGKQTPNTKSIFKDSQVEFWVVFDCLSVVPVMRLWRNTTDTTQGACPRSEMLMKSKVSDFRSIIATLPSVPCLQPEAPMAMHDCLDGSIHGANWQRSAHTSWGETAMSPWILKDFFALNRGGNPLIWSTSKIFQLVLVLLDWIPLFLGFWPSVHLTTFFVTERWKVRLGDTFTSKNSQLKL